MIYQTVSGGCAGLVFLVSSWFPSVLLLEQQMLFGAVWKAWPFAAHTQLCSQSSCLCQALGAASVLPALSGWAVPDLAVPLQRADNAQGVATGLLVGP